MHALIAALALISHQAESRTPSESFSIPFELDKGRIFVGAFVNGRGPYRFGFDTGASGTGRADVRLTAALSLRKVDQTATSDGIQAATADVVTAPSLRLGDLEQRGVKLLSRDYNKGRKADEQPLMGIIARDFFADWLVTLDYPARTISFTRGELRPNEPGVLSYGASFTIPVCFSVGCYPGKVDTGSSRGLVIPKNLAAKLPASAPVAIGQGMRTNSVATLYEMSLREPVRVGAVTAAAQKVLYADPSDTTIVIGSEFLKDYVLTIDQRHRLLRISEPRRR
jgi:hypothetical protein